MRRCCATSLPIASARSPSLLPGTGTITELADAALYAAEGDYVSAGIGVVAEGAWLVRWCCSH